MPVVVVGAGPVGIKTAQELHRAAPGLPVVVYGDEPCEPYNRVRLSGLLGGELTWHALTRDLALPRVGHVEARLGCAVTAIDRERRCVRDDTGLLQPYRALVLATGSRPHVPDIPGVRTPGVYTFRDARDAERLLARRVRSRHTVVLGGGLLGLEAAHAMQRYNTRVTVIEHYTRLMMRQLDEAAARCLHEHATSLGMDIVLGEGVKRVLGGERVAGVLLRSDRVVPCDTIIVATGIRPNVELARACGLRVERGIRVDDGMQTADPHIYAVGECAEHRERVYGLVAPGVEQAAVVAHRLAGGSARYAGSTVATRLKVVGLPTFSTGLVAEEETPDLAQQAVYRRGKSYRKLVVLRGKLVGALAVGDCPEASRLQEAVMRGRRVWPWQSWRFRRGGLLWPEQTESGVASWPAATTVCNCTGITCGELRAACAAGCSTMEALSLRTGAGTVCGSCRPLLAELAGAGGPRAPERGFRALAVAAFVAGIAALALLLAPAIDYASTATMLQWDTVWRDSAWKQVSGYTVLALGILGLAISLRKRHAPLARLGVYPSWRLAHALLGIAAIATLLVHTGGRLGSALNLALALCFYGLVIAGAAAAAFIALDHRMGLATSRRTRASGWWLHMLFAWPVPVLLVFHVLKTYYF